MHKFLPELTEHHVHEQHDAGDLQHLLDDARHHEGHLPEDVGHVHAGAGAFAAQLPVQGHDGL